MLGLAMLFQACPVCGRQAPLQLEESSKQARLYYYRCGCGHIWTTSKKDGSFVRHVTPLPKKPPADR